MFAITDDDYYLMILGTATNACHRLGIQIPDTATDFDRVMDTLTWAKPEVARHVNNFINAWAAWRQFGLKVDEQKTHGTPETQAQSMTLMKKRDDARARMLEALASNAPKK